MLEQDNRHVEMAGVVESAFNGTTCFVFVVGGSRGVLTAMVLFFKLQRLTAYSCVAVALLVAVISSRTPFLYPVYRDRLSFLPWHSYRIGG